jgi:hypothetical protein
LRIDVLPARAWPSTNNFMRLLTHVALVIHLRTASRPRDTVALGTWNTDDGGRSIRDLTVQCGWSISSKAIWRLPRMHACRSFRLIGSGMGSILTEISLCYKQAIAQVSHTEYCTITMPHTHTYFEADGF